MDLRRLSIQVMLAHSRAWLTTSDIRAALVADPLGAAVLDKLQGVHDRLAHLQNQKLHVSDQLRQLTAELTELDSIHDDRARAVHGVLSSLACGTGDPARRERYQEIQHMMFPGGLDVIRRAYLDEAGAAIELGRRLTQDTRAFLGQIPFDGGTLLDVVDAWIDAGQVLGQRTQERERLLASVGRDGTSGLAVDSRAARNMWVSAVRLLLHALDFMTVPAETREAVIAPLRRSIAARLLRGQDDATEQDGTGDDVTGGDDAADGDDLSAGTAGAGDDGAGDVSAGAAVPGDGAGANEPGAGEPARAGDARADRTAGEPIAVAGLRSGAADAQPPVARTS